MLTIRNREGLARSALLIPLIEQIALCISCGSSVRAIVESDEESRALPDWLIYADEHSRGIAVHPYDSVPAETPLRRRINYASHARKLVGCFGARQGEFPLYLREATLCPASWHVFRVSLRHGDLLCAASLPTPEVAFHGLHRAHQPVKVHMTFHSHVMWSQDISLGATQVFSNFSVVSEDHGLRGTLNISEEGLMTVTTSAVEQNSGEVSQAPLQIRVDLGEIELTLSELAALRAGSRIELETELPLQCYLRIGSSTLGVGEISRAQNGLRITLKEMIA